MGYVTILDAKRGDIAATAAAYAEAAFGGAAVDDAVYPVWDADALTVNPYLGEDAVEPFIGAALLPVPARRVAPLQPLRAGATSAKYVRNCFQRTARRSGPTKVSNASRRPVSLLPSSKSVWSTPSIGRSSGSLPPAKAASVGKKSMIENIA